MVQGGIIASQGPILQYNPPVKPEDEERERESEEIDTAQEKVMCVKEIDRDADGQVSNYEAQVDEKEDNESSEAYKWSEWRWKSWGNDGNADSWDWWHDRSAATVDDAEYGHESWGEQRFDNPGDTRRRRRRQKGGKD